MGYARELAELATAYNTGNPLTHRNKIINGGMVIDQRNAGASLALSNTTKYTVDRFAARASTGSSNTAQQSTTAPAGFKNSLKITSGSAGTVGVSDNNWIYQSIEGYNIADLGWGTASAKPITLSFQAYSSLTGTFGGVLRNSAGNRAYPFTYTISSANTWTSVSITVAGDISGTWESTNGEGIAVFFGLGSGSNYLGTAGAWAGADYRGATGEKQVFATSGATFYLTGVQLEAGRVATPFEMRSYGAELALCQRYFEKSYNQSVVPGTSTNVAQVYVNITSDGSGNAATSFRFAVAKRASPTVTGYQYTGTLATWNYDRSGAASTATPNFFLTGESGTSLYMAVGASWVPVFIQGQWTASAEL